MKEDLTWLINRRNETNANEQLPFLATADENGMPKVGPRILHVLDDTHLAYFEHTFRHAFHNLTENGRAAVAVAGRSAQRLSL